MHIPTEQLLYTNYFICRYEVINMTFSKIGVLTSNSVGAKIYIDNIDTIQITLTTITNLDEGTRKMNNTRRC